MRRRYRVASWCCAALLFVYVLVHASSGVWYLSWSNSSIAVGVGAGALVVATYEIEIPSRRWRLPTWSHGRHEAGLSDWWFTHSSTPAPVATTRTVIPLWVLAPVLTGAWLMCWRKDRPRRWLAKGLCTGCGYDLGQLDQCPECGVSR